MNHTVTAYLIYLPVALAMTVWVARTLHQNGRVFLVQAFQPLGNILQLFPEVVVGA